MGTCMSTQLPPNVFKVTPINDDRHNIQTGLLVVTTTNLKYTDSQTEEQLEWPLKYIRNWACEGNMFSFEAGKKCLGGEGLYAFNTDRASQLFKLVAHNLNLPMEATTTLPSSPHYPSRASQLPPPPIPPMGGPNRTLSSKAPAAPPPLPEPQAITKPYQVLEFDEEPKQYPPPPPRAAPNYTTIDFKETEQLRRSGNTSATVKPTLPDAKQHSRISSSSGINAPRKFSRSSIEDSQSSAVESKRDSTSSPNSSTVLPSTQNYKNIAFHKQGPQPIDRPQSNCEGSGAKDQHNHSNITVGQEVSSSLVLPQDAHSSYANLTLGHATPNPNELPSTPMTKISNTIVSSSSTPQDAHNSYANLTLGHATPNPNELPSTPMTKISNTTVSSSSTPQDAHNSYANLTLGHATPNPNELPSTPMTHASKISNTTVSSLVLSSTPQDAHNSYANLTLGTPKIPSPPKVSVYGSGNYPELDLHVSATATPPNGTPHPQLTPIAELGTAGANVEGGKGTAEGATGEAAVVGRPRDKENVNYGSLDFGVMKEVEKMQKERERLKQAGGEPMSRDKDRANSTQSHKKQK